MSVESEAGSLQMNGNNQHGMQDIHPEGHAPRHASAVVFFKVRNFHSEKQKLTLSAQSALLQLQFVALLDILRCVFEMMMMMMINGK